MALESKHDDDSSPEAWEGPSLRVVDFADNNPVMIISTALRRLWLIEPPRIDAKVRDRASQLEKEFHFATHANGNYITGAAPGRAWDDALWRCRTRYKLLDSPAGCEPDEFPLTAWRTHITNTYRHVFWDLHQSLKLEASHIGEFDPKNPDAVMLWDLRLQCDRHAESTTTTFRTDTFLYPVWLEADATGSVTVGDQHHTWTSDGSTWTSGVWVRHGVEAVITYQTQNKRLVGSACLTAVLTQGVCEPRKVAKPWSYDKDRPYDPESPELATEAVHLARAIWLQAGEVTNECVFDNTQEIPDTASSDEPSEPQLASSTDDNQHTDALYKPFPDEQSIRILQTLPGSDDTELQTRLVMVNLRDRTVYEALSYTWGDTKDKLQLPCAAGSVLIPRNLRDALRQLRCPDRTRYLWVDAVCINQDDLEERGRQVSIMRDIFQQASRVLVWLGTDPEQNAVPAFKAVCNIVRSWRPPGDKFQYTSYQKAFEPLDSGGRQYLHRVVNAGSWGALRSLFSSNYFRRFWIIQELSLSQSAVVLWGDHHIAWPLVGYVPLGFFRKAGTSRQMNP